MTTEQKYDCVFCQEVFEDKETLQIHFRKHGNPQFDFSTKIVKNRQNEIVPMEKVIDEIDMVGCDVCEEVFPTISKAITHKHKAHPDHEAKYFCSFCGKLFTMKHLLNKHIQSNHTGEAVILVSKDFHCDMCQVTFHVPSAMLYHNKFFHRQDTEMPAIGHSKKFKLFNQELVQIYYCSFCGEEFNNKVNLHKHTNDDHSDENQSPSEVLRCPLCEAIFYHLDAYELHLTFHSSEDIYSEKNELVEQSMEFSLETVPPITENVVEEQELPQQEDNTITNPDEINNFLQLVMGEQSDSVALEKIKHKKHKKHKKSKKASITLDEFLNMNKDVFGDGLGDVQGIEEVPTQVVLKKVKGKTQNRNEAKMVKADLAKLKKQGIIVKSKPKNNAVNVRNLTTPLSKQQNTVGSAGIIKNKHDISQNSPNDILSKLLNQGNSQIKIVKKPASQSNAGEVIDTQTSNIANHAKEDNSSFYTESECVNDVTQEIPKILENNSNDLDVKAYSEIPQETNKNSNNETCGIKGDDIDKKDIFVNTKHSANECIEKETSLLENNSLGCDSIHSTHEEPFRMLCETKHSILENDIVIDKNISTVDENKISLDVQNNEKEIEINSCKTINALKHLSHLITVKPLSNQSKDVNKSKFIEDVTTEDSLHNAKIYEGDESQKNSDFEKNIILNKPLKLKNQISSQKQSPTCTSPTDLEENDAYSNDLEFNVNATLEKKDTVNLNKSVIKMEELKVELVQPQSSYNTVSLKNQSVPSNNFAHDIKTQQEEKDTSGDISREVSNLNILKRLSNVTAKPITIPKTTNQHDVIKPLHTYATQVKGLVPKQINKGIDEDLEVYNIDDSDEDMDEEAVNNESRNKTSINNPSDTLKNLSRNITVKTSETKSNPKDSPKDRRVESNRVQSESYSESYTQIKNSKEIQKSINLQNKLKTLGNITVKPRNALPNAFNIDQSKSFDDIDEQSFESDSDSEHTGKVKITEVDDEYVSDNELNDVHQNHFIESPNTSISESEENQTELSDHLPDFENHIKTNMVKKDDPIILKKPIPHLENLINLNKALTVKSINKGQETISASQKDVSEDASNQEMAIKPYKPNLPQHEQSPNKNFQQGSGPSTQTLVNQKVNTASNQVNTVKTVKRFQSQTVIEEITTTVTKTIRTVNSSTNEVMQSTTQNTPKLINKSQKIINKQPGKELQGTTVRHASPTIGTKIRNAVPVVRTPNTGLLRPTQPVPMRPVFNRPRCPTPSTSAIRKVITPRSSPQKPAIGKLKISPYALNQTIKRPCEENLDQFPSSKKPKDININPPDLPDCNEDVPSIKYTSASQSHTEFSNITKNIKGKGTVTALQTRSEFSSSSQQQTSKTMGTQMRSEMSMSSQQQLSRLNNMSGLKIVKTSMKQATQVEEKCEISPGQRNTLQALEKLQKQGLLVKKPRIEEYNDESNSYSESDDEIEK